MSDTVRLYACDACGVLYTNLPALEGWETIGRPYKHGLATFRCMIARNGHPGCGGTVRYLCSIANAQQRPPRPKRGGGHDE